jgi:hypothetical protein
MHRSRAPLRGQGVFSAAHRHEGSQTQLTLPPHGWAVLA